MSNKILRWGIVGCGRISGDFCEALHLIPPGSHQVVAAAASKLDRAKTFIQKHNLDGAKAYGSYDELIADSNVEVVYIGLLNHMHKDVVLKALDGGKNVLCEKPMGLNDREVKEMVAKAREKKVYFQEAFWTRFFPIYKRIREELDSGNLGDVRIVQANLGFKMMDEPRIVSLEHGGGAGLDMGGYVIQIAMLAFGYDAEIKKIHVEGSRFKTGVDQTALISIEFSGGRFAQLLYTGEVSVNGYAIIAGTKNQLIIPEWNNAPEMLIKANYSPTDDDKKETMQHRRPDADPSKFYYKACNGMVHEAQGVRANIQAGMTESKEIPLDESIKISEIMTEIRRQLGVKFPQE